MKVTWIKCTSGAWCGFKTVNLESVKSHGVYIIWYQGNTPKTTYVGQGDVATRISDHRDNNRILKHAKDNLLLVTWARVNARDRDGIEAYLAAVLDPLVGELHPDAPFIEVNLPWK